jgi:carbonic anhydrase
MAASKRSVLQEASMSSQLSRRALFHTLACGCAALPAAFVAAPVHAASGARTELTADQALARLKEGNAAFVKGGACVATGGPARVAELSKGQAPFAVIVCCSDSRTPPEHLFGGGLGELFVVRVAGNTVDTSALGSIEYGVAVLGAPLIMVLGHSNCGAVEAAAKIVTENASYPGAIEGLVLPIVPSVLRAQKKGGDLIAAAVAENVTRVVERLKASDAILRDPIRAGAVKVAGGVYDLASGAVAFMA